MENPFEDVFSFNYASGNTRAVGVINWSMLQQAVDHCQEEWKELHFAHVALKNLYAQHGMGDLQRTAEHIKDVADGAMDLVYVATNVLFALGIDVNACWRTIQQANMAKIPDCETCAGEGFFDDGQGDRYSCEKCEGSGMGEPLRNAAGKILKPAGWASPDAKLVEIIKGDLT